MIHARPPGWMYRLVRPFYVSVAASSSASGRRRRPETMMRFQLAPERQGRAQPRTNYDPATLQTLARVPETLRTDNYIWVRCLLHEDESVCGVPSSTFDTHPSTERSVATVPHASFGSGRSHQRTPSRRSGTLMVGYFCVSRNLPNNDSTKGCFAYFGFYSRANAKHVQESPMSCCRVICHSTIGNDSSAVWCRGAGRLANKIGAPE
jgi:hypothetical protein